MIESLLIANRGEIACRVISTAKRLGIRTVAVYSDADSSALHVSLADSAVHIGNSPAAESYLNSNRIVAAAQSSGVQAIHPGYGFLSENPEFVDTVHNAGFIFVGPAADSIRAMGLKDAAKVLMEKAGVPVVPGYHGLDQTPELLAHEAAKIGYPVLIKARAGGGGKGMRLVETEADFAKSLESAAREGQTAFGDPVVLIEKFITSPRHVEVQVFGDNHGNVVHLFERDCSLQRRHQKVIEEAPAPGISDTVRQAMTDAAVKAARAINYSGAGTIEFIADGSAGLRADGFWFMEMNTRLQVEHPVTEAITGVDLVEWQIRVASGEELPLMQDAIQMSGHAFEARVYAEDVLAGFLPATGTLQHVSFAADARNDTGVYSGYEITPFYDPMIAKVITAATTRERALSKLTTALKDTHIAGTVTNLGFLTALSMHEEFVSGRVDTGLIERHLKSLTRAQPTSNLGRLLAALVLLGIEPNADLIGWRLWGDASHLLRLHTENESILMRLVVNNDGSFALQSGPDLQEHVRCSVNQLSNTRYLVEHNGLRKQAEVICWMDKSTHYASVLIEGQTSLCWCKDPLDVDTDQVSNSDQILAPMTGIVRQLDIEPGQSVLAGDRLLVLEAMKMETGVQAARDGVVKNINCRVDEAVDGGSVLVSLETLK